MSEIVGDSACPQCVSNGRDRTGNHLIHFEDGGAFCNRCGYACNWKNEGIVTKERTPITDEQLKELIEDFKSCKVVAWPERKLKQSTLARYDIRAGVDPTDKNKIGSYLIPLHEELSDGSLAMCGYKVRLTSEKRFFCQGRPKNAVLFGEDTLPKGKFKKLFITEAPLDAASLYQAIKDSWKGTPYEKYEPNVVSLPHGTDCAVKVLSERMKVVSRAEEIVLVMDNDEAGNRAVDAIRSLLPNVKFVSLPLKDCNDMLVANRDKELAKLAVFGAQTVKMEEVVDIGDIEEDILKRPEYGYSYPWKSLTDSTYGIRTTEIIGFAGGVGIGKSEFKYAIAEHLVSTEGINVGVFDLEATVGKTGKALVGKRLKRMLHKPSDTFDKSEVAEAVKHMSGKVKLYKHRGSKDWKDIKAAMRYQVVVCGVKVVFIDPITALVAHLTASEANDVLNNMMADLASMTLELDFAVIYFAHLNPPNSGPPHERGGRVHETQLTGSRAMIKWSHYIIGLERNKDPVLPEFERNITKVLVLKDREFGNACVFNVFWNKDTGELEEMFA